MNNLGDILTIQFPVTQYSNLSAVYASGNPCQASILPDAFNPSIRSLPCIYDLVNLQFQLTMKPLTSGLFSPHSVVIYGIQNPPETGGTGYFRLESRRGTSNLLDYNHLFDLLGFVPQPLQFASVTSSITANGIVNLNGTYQIVFQTSITIPANGLIVFTFPSTVIVYPDFSYTLSISAGSCSLTAPNVITITVNFVCFLKLSNFLDQLLRELSLCHSQIFRIQRYQA